MSRNRELLSLLKNTSAWQALRKVWPKQIGRRVKRKLRAALGLSAGQVDESKSSFSKGRRTSANSPLSAIEKPLEAYPRYEVGIFSAFGEHVAAELRAVKYSHTEPRKKTLYAAWALGRWHHQEGRYADAVKEFTEVERLYPDVKSDQTVSLLLADSLIRSGQKPEALKHIERLDPNTEVFAIRGNLSEEANRLQWINEAFRTNGLTPIRLKDESRSLSIDNIVGTSTGADPLASTTRVSVIVPAYNAERFLHITLEGLLAQTWDNLEILVVDDCSTDNTWDVIQDFASRFPNIVPLRNLKNGGAYAARNTGLRHATGEYVTVNDSDDWSHPEKIAVHIRDAIESGAKFSSTDGFRLTPELEVQISSRFGAMVVTNLSSVLYKREDLLTVGGWHQTRFGADAELVGRMEKFYGRKIYKAARKKPLTLIVNREGSLTNTSLTGKKSFFYGARREYREAFAHWHETTGELTLSVNTRPFAVPAIMTERPAPTHDVDLLFISDFSLPGGTTSSNIAMWEAAAGAGISVAALHWPRLAQIHYPIQSKVRHQFNNGKAQPIVAGESVRARLAIVNHPNILMNPPSVLPALEIGASVVIFNQAPVTLTEGGRRVYDPRTVMDNARKLLGTEPLAAPLSGLIRDILREYEIGAAYTQTDWTPLIDLASLQRSPRRPAHDRRPVIGRHSRDHLDKWSDNPKDLAAAYVADTDIVVRILGGAKFPTDTLGKTPYNWDILPFGSSDVSPFLDTLDFYVYFTRDHMIEAFGRAPMEAIAAGIPTILPAQFRSTFGDAAIYANPNEVKSVIEALWNDPEGYIEQSRKGLDFIAANCDTSIFKRRVEPFLFPSAHVVS